VPRGRRRQQPSSSSSGGALTPGQSTYVLERMIAERRISPGEVNRYVSDMHREIGDLERRLQSLRAASVGSGGVSAAAAAPAPRRRGRPPGSPNKAAAAAPSAPAKASAAKGGARRRSAITPEQLASRQLQGRYLGLIRQIAASKRGGYQRTAKEKGREAAIRDMQDALKK